MPPGEVSDGERVPDGSRSPSVTARASRCQSPVDCDPLSCNDHSSGTVSTDNSWNPVLAGDDGAMAERRPLRPTVPPCDGSRPRFASVQSLPSPVQRSPGPSPPGARRSTRRTGPAPVPQGSARTPCRRSGAGSLLALAPSVLRLGSRPGLRSDLPASRASRLVAPCRYVRPLPYRTAWLCAPHAEQSTAIVAARTHSAASSRLASVGSYPPPSWRSPWRRRHGATQHGRQLAPKRRRTGRKVQTSEAPQLLHTRVLLRRRDRPPLQ